MARKIDFRAVQEEKVWLEIVTSDVGIVTLAKSESSRIYEMGKLNKRANTFILIHQIARL